MKIDFEEIFKNLDGMANAIYTDKDRLRKLLIAAKKKAEGNKQLSELWQDLKLLLELIKDWMKGEYKELAKSTVLLIIGSLIYLVSPIDLIPDFLIGGFIDDIAVLGYVIKKISDELNAYKIWKNVKYEDIIFEVEKEDKEDIIDMEDNETFSV